MWNVGQLVNAVQKNCHISDAHHAGELTLCDFLLKMREYYRWEHALPFSCDIPKEAVSEWLRERERAWERLNDRPLEQLPLTGGLHNPFDAQNVNRELVPHGYVYGGGYGRRGKPIFFLGRLDRHERRGGCTVYVSSCEYARDLEAPPAMLQGRTIYVRQESLRRVIWEKIEEWRWGRKKDGPMRQALAGYRFNGDVDASLDRVTAQETETVILHELGEARAGELLGEDWEHMLASLARSRAELVARAVRDLAADCLSTLPGLLEHGAPAPLHFYFAGFGGMRRELFPEALEAYRRWTDGDDDALRRLAEHGASRWLGTAHDMLASYRQFGADPVVLEKKLSAICCQ